MGLENRDKVTCSKSLWVACSKSTTLKQGSGRCEKEPPKQWYLLDSTASWYQPSQLHMFQKFRVPKTQTEINCNPERRSWHDEMSVIKEIGLTETKNFVAVMSDNLAKQKQWENYLAWII